MTSHAKPFPRWLDTLASFLSWRVSAGRHTLRVQPGREPFGADLQWPDELALLDVERATEITQEIPVVRAEVKA